MKPKPTPQEVKRLMHEYTNLDYLMAETLLMFEDHELEDLFADKKSAPKDNQENAVSGSELSSDISGQ